MFDISVLALCAVISGAEGWDDRSTAPAQADWLKEFLDLTHGILSPDAFCRVFFQLNRTAIHFPGQWTQQHALPAAARHTACRQEVPAPSAFAYVSVDWQLTHNSRNFYIFGVGDGNAKAKNVAVSLLEIQKTAPPFISLIVHEDMEALGKQERLYLTRNTDTQYPVLVDFKEKGAEDIRRFAA